MVKIAFVGNFVPLHSTENHVAQAFERLGHIVTRIQEGSDDAYEELMVNDVISMVDMLLWVRTGDLAAKWGHRKQLEMLTRAKNLDIPTVAFHLDRWWDLDREAAVWEEPFFRCSIVITADGGHDEQFFRIGVNHVWLPPGVSLGETAAGEYRERYASDIAFVGSWQSGYHKEWTHRPELVRWLRDTYLDQIQFWPRPNEHAVRGTDLRNLYASVKVVVGDSCLVGGIKRYWSDRIPETLGRGGFLIHPHVDGLEEHYTVDEHLVTWPAGDWGALKHKIDYYLSHDDERQQIAAAGKAHVIKNHTYDTRAGQILEIAK